MSKITVLVADSQHLVGQCLAAMLGKYDDLWVLEELPASGPEALEAAAVWTPDVILLDYWITGMDGPAVTHAIRGRVPACKVILLSWFHAPETIRSGLKAGAVGYLPKSVDIEEVVEAIRRANAGEKMVFARELESMVQNLGVEGREVAELAGRFSELTPRETHVLILLSRGGPIDELAAELSISRTTLKTHIRHILIKTGARSHSEAVAMALRCGWIKI